MDRCRGEGGITEAAVAAHVPEAAATAGSGTPIVVAAAAPAAAAAAEGGAGCLSGDGRLAKRKRQNAELGVEALPVLSPARGDSHAVQCLVIRARAPSFLYRQVRGTLKYPVFGQRVGSNETVNSVRSSLILSSSLLDV